MRSATGTGGQYAWSTAISIPSSWVLIKLVILNLRDDEVRGRGAFSFRKNLFAFARTDLLPVHAWPCKRVSRSRSETCRPPGIRTHLDLMVPRIWPTDLRKFFRDWKLRSCAIKTFSNSLSLISHSLPRILFTIILIVWRQTDKDSAVIVGASLRLALMCENASTIIASTMLSIMKVAISTQLQKKTWNETMVAPILAWFVAELMAVYIVWGSQAIRIIKRAAHASPNVWNCLSLSPSNTVPIVAYPIKMIENRVR